MLSNQHAEPVRPRRVARAVFGAISVPVVVALLSGCAPGTISVAGTAGPVDTAQATSPNQTASASSAKAASVTAADPVNASAANGKGCAAGGPAIPKGAGKGIADDLDGDGRADTVWLADKGSKRLLGVKTASGARFSTVFTSADTSQAAAALGGRLGNGIAVILLDTGRSVALYTVIGCAIVPTQNVNGEQYQFDRGFTGYGSGVGCPVFPSEGRRLVGYLAKSGDDGVTFTVTQTRINFSAGGLRATNGNTVTTGSDAPADSPIVQKAQQINCGDGRLAVEPQS